VNAASMDTAVLTIGYKRPNLNFTANGLDNEVPAQILVDSEAAGAENTYRPMNSPSRQQQEIPNSPRPSGLPASGSLSVFDHTDDAADESATIRSYCVSHQNDLSYNSKFGYGNDILPGPFVVMQGLCVDGIRNTVDTSPVFPHDVLFRMMENSMNTTASENMGSYADKYPCDSRSPKDGRHSKKRLGDPDHSLIYGAISDTGFSTPDESDIESIYESISSWESASHCRKRKFEMEHMGDKTEPSNIFLQNFPYQLNGLLCVYDALPVPNDIGPSSLSSIKKTDGTPATHPVKPVGVRSINPKAASLSATGRTEGLNSGRMDEQNNHEVYADAISTGMSHTSLDTILGTTLDTTIANLDGHACNDTESRSVPETVSTDSERNPYNQYKVESNEKESNSDNSTGVTPKVIGSLHPGMVVTGLEIISIDPTKYQSGIQSFVPSIYTQIGTRKSQKLEYLRIDSPFEGFVLLSRGSWHFLAPGMPDSLGGAGDDGWAWRVVCRDGAFIRNGLDLLSDHKCTIPHGSLVRVSSRTINTYGLSRLMIRAKNTSAQGAAVITSTETTLIKPSHGNEDGWASEMLNPLSGQRGSIIEPLSFPVPMIFKVILSGGAVVRSTKELSSPEIRVAQPGELLRVISRAFSEHPKDCCLERLQIAGNGGWISAYLNCAPPLNHPVVELISEDSDFEPTNPGVYHLMASLECMKQLEKYDTPERAKFGNINSGGKQEKNPMGRGSQGEQLCLVCLTEERTATIVHGETGHICCCLQCARILMARGDPCPVCRTKIDLVIQHFDA